jgi:hypothetical protein
MSDVESQVLMVGGGGAGLTASMLLSKLGDAIYRRATPAENMLRTAWYAGLTGPHDGYGRQIGAIESRAELRTRGRVRPDRARPPAVLTKFATCPAGVYDPVVLPPG